MLGRASQLADWACTPLLYRWFWCKSNLGPEAYIFCIPTLNLGALAFIHTMRASARAQHRSRGWGFPFLVQVGLSPLRDTRLWGVSSLLRARPSAGGGLLPYIRAQINGCIVGTLASRTF